MQTNWMKLTSSPRSLATALVLLAAMFLCLGALAHAQLPIVVSGAPTQLGALTSGGWDGSQEPIGGTFVIGLNGDVLVGDGYTANFLQITPSGTDTVLAAGVGGSNAALDSYGNLYFGGNYNANIYKVPYNASTGAYVGWTGSAPTTNCLGGNQDTAPCVFAPAVSAYLGTLGGQGFAGLGFDAAGDLFFETNTLPTTNPNTIFECNLACIANSSATPAVIYKDASSVGAFQIDPWGNLFFVDGNNGQNKVTNLNEIPLSSGSYAASPTVLLSYTNKVGYSNGISGLAIAGNGTIYFSTPADGLFAIPNTKSGGPNVSGTYMLSTQGGKGVAIDAAGNLYGVPYNGGDVVSFIPVGSFALAATTIGGTASTASVNVFDNSASCTPTETESALAFGKTSTDFAITPGTSCGGELGTGNGTFSPALSVTGAMTSATITFSPTTAGARNAAFVIANSATGATGEAALTGIGQSAAANVDPGLAATYTSGLSSPAYVIPDPAGDLFVANSLGGQVFEIASGSTTPVSFGTFSDPAALAFDVNGNLFIADAETNSVDEIVNTGATGTFVAGAQSTLVSSSMPFAGEPLGGTPVGLAVAPGGTLYIADNTNHRVVFYNPITGTAGVTCVTSANGAANPIGVAVDPSGNLYAADDEAGKVFICSAGAVSTTAVSGVTAPSGVAVDASGSLLIVDNSTGNVVRVPYLSGALAPSQAIAVEAAGAGARSIVLDAMGNMYVANPTSKSVYAIQRTVASTNLGTVQDGLTNSSTVYLMNAGNETATLGTPDVIQPTNTMFTLEPAATNGCTAGSQGPAGSSCVFAATFAPAVGTANGAQAGTATIDIGTPALSLAVDLSGTATQSSILAQTITNFNPPPSLLVGQQTTLTATGGGSGNPVIFSIDPASSCASCAIAGGANGSTLSAVGAGSVIVDANQAAGTNNGNQYAAAKQVQATITITNATQASEPSIVATQATQIGVLGGTFGGGWNGSQSPLGGTFVVGPNGTVVIGGGYGGNVTQIPAGGTQTILANAFNSATAAEDPSGNVYIAADGYNGNLYKLPYNSTTGTYSGFTVNTSNYSGYPGSNCAGGTQDTAACVYAPNLGSFIFGSGAPGFAAIAFDPTGNLIAATDAQSTFNKIFLCNAACEIGGTANPTLLYTDTLNIGALAVDPWGNIFFVDGSNGSKGVTNLEELPLVSGAYAAAPTLVLSYTNAAGYSNGISGLTIAPSGTIYFATDGDGIYAIPNTSSGGPNLSGTYAASTVSGKGIALDSQGNLYQIPYNGGDVVDLIGVDNLTAPVTPVDGASTASVTLFQNVVDCSSSPAPVIVATQNGNPTSVFSGAVSGGCSAPLGTGNGTFSPAITITGSVVPATINFDPTVGGPVSATLTISDPVNGGLGTATITGIGQEVAQTITYTAPSATTFTYAPGLQITLGATGGGSNNPIVFTVDATSTGAGAISGNTLTVTQAGSIVIDANQVGGYINNVYYQNATQAQLPLTINQAAQTIVFPQPLSPVTYATNPSTTVTLSANGGLSGNPVNFTVDASSTGSGTISSSTLSNGTSSATLTVTGAGNIVVDANQATNVDYLAAAQVQQTIVVNQASQSIVFTPLTQPFYYIASGAALTIQATGGGSDNAIVFAVDPKSTMTGSFSTSTVSGAVSTAVLTMPANQSPASGVIVVDATQPGNSNYAAAAQTQFTIMVGAPLPTQTITFNQPQTQVAGTTLALTATASSGFPVSYLSSTTSVCTVSGSTATFLSTVASASPCTITATQPGDNQYFAAAPPVSVTFAVNPAGMTPALTVNLSESSLNIEPGTVGLTQITVNSNNNFAAAQVAFTCSNVPTGYTCAFNPSTITQFTPSSTTGLPGTSAATTTLTVSAPASAALVRHDGRGYFPAAFAVALCLLGFRKRNRLQLLLLLAAVFAGLSMISACGGSSSTTTKPVTSSITVTATGGGSTVTSTLSITVE